MFTAAFTVCLLAAPQTCAPHVPQTPPSASFSQCLHDARMQAVLFNRQHRDRTLTQITCSAAAPGKGR